MVGVEDETRLRRAGVVELVGFVGFENWLGYVELVKLDAKRPART